MHAELVDMYIARNPGTHLREFRKMCKHVGVATKDIETMIHNPTMYRLMFTVFMGDILKDYKENKSSGLD